MRVGFRPAIAATTAASLAMAMLAVCGCLMMVENHECCAAEGPVLSAVAASCCQPSKMTTSSSSELAPSLVPANVFAALAVADVAAPHRVVPQAPAPAFSPPTVLRI